MARFSNATPLIALDAFVIDTETTGLDPAKARVVEIGAVPLRSGKLDETAALRRLVNPGEPIPAEATRIHAIDDSVVASAPKFAAAWPDISAATSGAILIGHTLGFDLAVLKRECERAGLPWVRPRTLDTRLLAQVAEPTSRRLHARAPGELAWRDNRRPPFRARRRHRHGQNISRAAAQAARGQHPYAGRGRAGLPDAHRACSKISTAPAGKRRSRGRVRVRSARSRASIPIPTVIASPTS